MRLNSREEQTAFQLRKPLFSGNVGLRIPASNYRALLDFLPNFTPFQSEYHVACPLKEAFALFPTHAAFAMLQAVELAFHLPTA